MEQINSKRDLSSLSAHIVLTQSPGFKSFGLGCIFLYPTVRPNQLGPTLMTDCVRRLTASRSYAGLTLLEP